MTRLSLTPELENVAKRVIWFEEPEQAISNPIRFACYARTYATYEDVVILRRYLTDDDLREALSNAPAEIFDGRSWAYWHLMLDCYPAPPLPQRTFS